MTNHLLPRSALDACGKLGGMRVFAQVVVAALVILVCASFVVPWTQSARGNGRVVAYHPVDRETPIRAPIDGRVVRWHVAEGAHVEPGQPIAELQDNDPAILDRLGSVRDATLSQGRAMATAVETAEERMRALSDARDAAIDNAATKVKIMRDEREAEAQKLVAARATAATAETNLRRQRDLNQQGLTSDRDLELAELTAATANSGIAQMKANVRAAERAVEAAEATLAEVREKSRAEIEKARAELAKLRAEASEVSAKTAEAETKLSRQSQMTIVAPRAGRILSVTARQGTDFIKAGDTLAVLVPETDERAVELWVDGNDAPLIYEGRKVRVQFEGWPAVQFVGWPSVAVGTFGGRVAFVDPASRNDGMFRVMVVPDGGDEPWPDARYLRQGVRARGWVLLDRVSVAYEVWRQLNGFPPAMPAPPEKS